MNVGDLQGASHFKIGNTKYAKEKIDKLGDRFFTVRYERIKFLVVGIENSLSIYAWAPRPYSKFMAFKVSQASSQASSNPFAE